MHDRPPRRLRALASTATIALTTVALFSLLAEVGLRVFYPQVLLFPRWEHSDEYGILLPRNTTMLHRRPGHWEYRYTINAYRCRGPYVSISNEYNTRNIVVLGDSYGMGMGVDDGEEFPAVMAAKLGDAYRVINTSTPGWGLTQQIRRFYEFGQLYRPRAVILQFCANDPADNLRDRVTRIEKGRFTFHDSQRSVNPVFKSLSRFRLVQASHLYALIRAAYEARRDANVANASAPTDDESVYNELLELFAHDLRESDIDFIVIDVDAQLDRFPGIKARVQSLHADGSLRYLDTVPWLAATSNYSSPEGHRWGAKAHQVIGEKLADSIRNDG
ncbi:MAG: hypothetical protein AMXMBFR4_22950 [Candidatus Hydrogenedentota bacterium]